MTMVTTPIGPPPTPPAVTPPPPPLPPAAPPPPPVRGRMPRWLTALLAGLFVVVTIGVAVGSFLAVDRLLRGPGSDRAPQADVAVTTCRVTTSTYDATVRVVNREPETAVFTIRVRWYNDADHVVAETREQVEVPGHGDVLIEASTAKSDGAGASCSAGAV